MQNEAVGTSDTVTVDFYHSLVVSTAQKARAMEAELLEINKRLLSLERKLTGVEAGQEFHSHLHNLGEDG